MNWTWSSTGRAIRAFAAASAVGLLAAAPAQAANERPTLRFNATGQAAARAAVMTKADLASTGWTGGAAKPKITPYPECPGFHPKQADLVMTGAAQATYFHSSGIGFDTVSQVMQTAKMVRLDWQRTVLDPRVTPCVRYRMQQDARGSTYTFLSLKPLSFPRVAPFTHAWRVLYDDKASGKKVRIFLDLVGIGVGRTEILMSVSGPLVGADAVVDAEVRLARILVARAKAT
jgi:hypothetical protein